MLPSSASAKSFAAFSVDSNWYGAVRYTGTARAVVAGSGAQPPWMHRLSGLSSQSGPHFDMRAAVDARAAGRAPGPWTKALAAPSALRARRRLIIEDLREKWARL